MADDGRRVKWGERERDKSGGRDVRCTARVSEWKMADTCSVPKARYSSSEGRKENKGGIEKREEVS